MIITRVKIPARFYGHAPTGRSARRDANGGLAVAVLAFLYIMIGLTLSFAQSSPYFDSSAELDRFVGDLVTRTVAQFSAPPNPLRADQLAVTLVDLQAERPTAGHHRGDVRIYPASVVKIFYEAMAYHQIDEEARVATAELNRASVDMIRDSNNDATAYIVDLVTDTTSGPELPPAEFAAWGMKRNAVNRYFAGRGYTNINANQKPWSFGPYGRELQYVRSAGSNALTTSATARLLHEIYTGRFVNTEASAKLLGLLQRDLTEPFRPYRDDQAFGFIGRSLPAGSFLWSKAGWTSRDRHDAAIVTLPDGTSYILVIFTSGHASQAEIIHYMSRLVVDYMQGRGAKPTTSNVRIPLAARIQNGAGGSGTPFGGPARYWSPGASCRAGGRTYYTTTPTSFPDGYLNYAVIPAPSEAQGRRVQVGVWVPACDGNAKVRYYIHTGDTDYGPYIINQLLYGDEFVNVGPPITLSGESYLYFTDYAPQSGTLALSDVQWQALPAGQPAPEPAECYQPAPGKGKKLFE